MWWMASALAAAGPWTIELEESELAAPTTADLLDEPRAIVNGQTDGRDRFPATVYLQSASQTAQGVCSGTLVHPEWILTAAHCLQYPDDSVAVAVQVIFGIGGASGFLGARAGRELAIHPEWNRNELGRTPDIALVRIDPVTSIAPVPINDKPTDTPEWAGIELELVGFGIVGDGQFGTGGVRRVADSVIVDVNDFTVRTEDPEQNVCSGDSGGPMYRFTEVGLEVVGVNSFVAGGCNNGLAGATRVDAYADWIQGFVPDVPISAARAPSLDIREIEGQVGPGSRDPELDAPEWDAPSVPPRDLHGGGCSHGGAPFAPGLVLFAWLGRRRRRG